MEKTIKLCDFCGKEIQTGKAHINSYGFDICENCQNSATIFEARIREQRDKETNFIFKNSYVLHNYIKKLLDVTNKETLLVYFGSGGLEWTKKFLAELKDYNSQTLK